jgi:hypothetical protein
MHPTVASKNQQPSTVPRAVTGTSPKPQGGLWLDVSPLLGSHQGGAGQGPQAGQGLWLVPGQTQTLQAQASRRYQLGLRAKPAPTEAPAEAPAEVLIHFKN